jgi:hypothetical protein
MKKILLGTVTLLLLCFLSPSLCQSAIDTVGSVCTEKGPHPVLIVEPARLTYNVGDQICFISLAGLQDCWPNIDKVYVKFFGNNPWSISPIRFEVGQVPLPDVYLTTPTTRAVCCKYWVYLTDASGHIITGSDPYDFTTGSVPSLTTWGMVALVALVLGSTIFIMLRRRKAAVPA